MDWLKCMQFVSAARVACLNQLAGVAPFMRHHREESTYQNFLKHDRKIAKFG